MSRSHIERRSRGRQGKRQAGTPGPPAAPAHTGAGGPAEAAASPARRMSDGPWWVRDPGRLEREETALQAAGLTFNRDQAAFGRGVARLRVTMPPPAAVVVTVTFPDAFPHFKPVVTGPDLGFGHHYNPTTGEYCLLEPGDWQPESGRLVDLLTTQWRKLTAADAGEGHDPATGELVEADQAEPVSMYMQTILGSHLLLDAAPNLPADVDTGPAGVLLNAENPPRGFVWTFATADGRELLGARPLFVGDLPGVPATWVRLREPLPAIGADDVWAAVQRVAPMLDDGPWVPWPSGTARGKAVPLTEHLQLVLVTFPEEVSRRQVGEGWIAVLRARPNMRKPPRRPQLVRVARAGRDDLQQRTPELRPMRDKTVLLVGGGGLGSALVLLLAQMCPGRLTLIDGDDVDAATAVRFPSALRFAAVTKTEALKQLVCETQPFTDTNDSMHLRLGTPRFDDRDPRNLHEEVLRRVADADLVVDTTADRGAQHYLSTLARDLGKAYLQAEATPGVWGGLVALHRPDGSACWMCLQHHLDHTIAPLPANTAPGVQPPGCAQPTYTGTGFDLTTIAAHAARVAAAYLTGDNGYGSFDADVFTIALRDADGRAIPAAWTAHHIARHPDCRNHSTDDRA